MLNIEKTAQALRHAPGLQRFGFLWNLVRPAYNRFLNLLTGDRGLPRHINGTELVLLDTRFRSVPDAHEPELWKEVIKESTPGRTVVDVGANIGLYVVAIAKRVGSQGHVIAAEPDPANAEALRRHLSLNGVENQVEVVESALSDKPGTATLHVQGKESRITDEDSANSDDTIEVPMTTLDDLVADRKIDLLLIDVEGFEESVLRGGIKLLSSAEQRPSSIFIEVHPFAWSYANSSSNSLLGCLNECGYDVTDLTGKAVDKIESYGHIVARPR